MVLSILQRKKKPIHLPTEIHLAILSHLCDISSDLSPRKSAALISRLRLVCRTYASEIDDKWGGTVIVRNWTRVDMANMEKGGRKFTRAEVDQKKLEKKWGVGHGEGQAVARMFPECRELTLRTYDYKNSSPDLVEWITSLPYLTELNIRKEVVFKLHPVPPTAPLTHLNRLRSLKIHDAHTSPLYWLPFLPEPIWTLIRTSAATIQTLNLGGLPLWENKYLLWRILNYLRNGTRTPMGKLEEIEWAVTLRHQNELNTNVDWVLDELLPTLGRMESLKRVKIRLGRPQSEEDNEVKESVERFVASLERAVAEGGSEGLESVTLKLRGLSELFKERKEMKVRAERMMRLRPGSVIRIVPCGPGEGWKDYVRKEV